MTDFNRTDRVAVAPRTPMTRTGPLFRVEIWLHAFSLR